MTNFWRNGHWRNSVNGNLHYVSGHNVSRFSISNYSYQLYKNDVEIDCLQSVGNIEKIAWITLQLNKLEINFKNLDHLVKYKGSYKKAVSYFGNIYDRTHEDWMNDFQNEHNLPYPDPPEEDWYYHWHNNKLEEHRKKLEEQRRLEEKWKQEASLNNYTNNAIANSQVKDKSNKDKINKDNKRLIWIEIQIKKLNINFKNLDHLVKYKGSYKKAVSYFGNIYDRTHEDWMNDFQNEHNLPCPDPPEEDWFDKLKEEQRRLEEKWKNR